jgi:UPF0716 protein FxsA
MPLLPALTVLIFMEIALFVTIGAWIGPGWTLLVVLGSAVAGALILRAAGRSALERVMGVAIDGRGSLRQAADRLLLALAGALLILPGFLTDLLGLLLLLPPARWLLLSRLGVVAGQPGTGARIDDAAPGSRPRPGGPSPWSGTGDTVDAEVIEETPAPRSSSGQGVPGRTWHCSP